jgi:hypothetical protein
MKKLTQSEFLEKLKKNQPEIYENIKFKEFCKKHSKKVIIFTKYGECIVAKGSLLNGYFPSIAVATDKTEYFKNILLEKDPLFFETYNINNNYINTSNKLIISDKYGKCKIKPYDLLSGIRTCITNAVNKTEYWMNMAQEVHGDKYDYSLVEYVNDKTKLKIICKKHGIFEQTSNSHLSNRGCNKCGIDKNIKNTVSNTLDFVQKANIKHNFKYTYTKTNYVKSYLDVIITCPIHGDFLQRPNNHLTGSDCYKCGLIEAGKNIALDVKVFHEKAKDKHNNFYTYDLSNYINTSVKINITCPIHGVFQQTPDSHLQGQGCKICGRIRITNFQKENACGWHYSDWEKTAKKSKNFDSFKCYIIKCWTDDETFYKIGKTFTTLKKRFGTITLMPYTYEIVKEIIGDAFYISSIEKKLHLENKDNKYIPFKSFGGKNECFSQININNDLLT